MFEVIRIPAFKDNYIWLIRQGHQVIVVDPGESASVLEYLVQHNLELAAILVTHHHADHQGGIAGLVAHCKTEVIGPATESITSVTKGVEGDEFFRLAQSLGVRVISVPGHTRGHVAYLIDDCLFCGDTLFAGGCGRVFEGTPKQLFQSLSTLAALPDTTRVYCAHEYTQSNLRFALTVDPNNQELIERVEEVDKLRAQGLATVPTSMAIEKATNPFLRCDDPLVRQSAQSVIAGASSPESVFAALRDWKNNF